MATKLFITVSTKFAWWVRPYIFIISAFSRMTGLQFNESAVKRLIMRGVRVEVNRGD